MEIHIGKVTHYYDRIGVAVVALTAELKLGDTIAFRGHNTEFVQPVSSVEIDHQKVESAGPGAEVAVKVDDRVREGDSVFKVVGG
jgi:multidrug efflux pump subunit AcrA (membrane-fusion protein)